MKTIQLFLKAAATPGEKPEFLATLQPTTDATDDAMAVWNAVREEGDNDSESTTTTTIVLDGYTREGWAWKQHPPTPTTSVDGNNSNSATPTVAVVTTVPVESTDGRHKLPGFIAYLKERQKSAHGRFGRTGVFVVSYVQQQQLSNNIVVATDASDQRSRATVRIAMDVTKIPHCPLKPKLIKAKANTTTTKSPHRTSNPNNNTSNIQQQSKQVSAQSASASSSNPSTKSITTTASSSSSRRKGAGLLGQLLGAQQRTDHYTAEAANAASTSSSTADATATQQQQQPWKTVQQVFAEFRQKCQDLMLDFDLLSSNDNDAASPNNVLKIPIVLNDHTRFLASTEEKSQVTLDVLKYMIYEAAEEVNDEWAAHREPSEFVDDVVIAVYKVAPPHVLEELNMGELPDEVRGQQRALQDERARSVHQAELKLQQKQQQMQQKQRNGDMVHNDDDDDNDDDMEALNTKKRDRRTIADYEREKLKQVKRQIPN